MIDYTVIRSRRRTLALEVTRQGTALVRAPLRASDADIARFVDSHRGWLEKHLAARQAFLATHPEPSAAQADAWRQQAKETLPPLVAHWAQRMGLQPAGITVTAARTRFGSCSGKNRLSFSLYLMAYPETAIEYVVVHELAHIRHTTTPPPSTARWKPICPTGGRAAPSFAGNSAILRRTFDTSSPPVQAGGGFLVIFTRKPPSFLCVSAKIRRSN